MPERRRRPRHRGRKQTGAAPGAKTFPREETVERLRTLGYQLGRKVGGGGNGTVFDAIHEGTDARVVKVLRHDSRPALVRFKREVAVQATLAPLTSGVLAVFEYYTPTSLGKTTSQPFFLMPKASDLGFQIDPSQDPFDVLRAFLSVARTLHFMHARGMAHRDIKPANILRDGEETVLTDFGLAISGDPETERLTAGKSDVGPKHFLPEEMLEFPESAQGGPVDVFEWAKSLWVCLAFRQYPPQGSLITGAKKHDLLAIRPDLGQEFSPVQRLIERATRLEPPERPTVEDCIAELEAVLGDKLIATTEMSDADERLAALGRRLKALPPPGEPAWRLPSQDLEAALAELESACLPSVRMLSEAGITAQDYWSPGDYMAAAATQAWNGATRGIQFRSRSVGISLNSTTKTRQVIAVAVAEDDSKPGNFVLGAGSYFSSISVTPGKMLGSITRSVSAGSAQIPSVAAEIAAELALRLPGWIEEVLDTLPE